MARPLIDIQLTYAYYIITIPPFDIKTIMIYFLKILLYFFDNYFLSVLCCAFNINTNPLLDDIVLSPQPLLDSGA